MSAVYQQGRDAINIYTADPAKAGIYTPRPIGRAMRQTPPLSNKHRCFLGPGVRQDDALRVSPAASNIAAIRPQALPSAASICHVGPAPEFGENAGNNHKVSKF
jgi:hypothetical protein